MATNEDEREGKNDEIHLLSHTHINHIKMGAIKTYFISKLILKTPGIFISCSCAIKNANETILT
jgi:Cft2 family RNA processing exonuclease